MRSPRPPASTCLTQRRLGGGRCHRRRLRARRAVPAHVQHRRRCILADLRRAREQGVVPRRRGPGGGRRDAGALRRPGRDPVPRSRAGDAHHARRRRQLLRGARASRPAAVRALPAGRDSLRRAGLPGIRARFTLDRADRARARRAFQGDLHARGKSPGRRKRAAQRAPRRNAARDRRTGPRRLLRGRGGQESRAARRLFHRARPRRARRVLGRADPRQLSRRHPLRDPRADPGLHRARDAEPDRAARARVVPGPGPRASSRAGKAARLPRPRSLAGRSALCRGTDRAADLESSCRTRNEA